MAQTEREALVALCNATGGPIWQQNGNCNIRDLSQWHGINTNDQGRVVEINLFSNNVQGHIPEVLGALSQLEGLYLSFNQLTGKRRVLTITLPRWALERPIPKELGSLSNLEQLWLQHNNLTGPTMPKELGSLSNLEQLWLQHNNLTGTVPEELENLTALTHLWLSNNRLEAGHIPKELGALSKLEVLQLRINHLTGENCQANNLGSSLRHCRFALHTGAIPKELGDLRAITHLDLSRNKLNGESSQSIRLRKIEITISICTLVFVITHMVFEKHITNMLQIELTGGSLTLWQEKVRGARRKEPWAISLADFLVSLWHFLLPVIDDVTDVILLSATFKDGGGLWWACFGAFVLADFERVLLLLVTLLLVLCWVPFALLGTNETRGKRFKVALKVLNGWHELHLEPVFLRNDDRGVPVWGNLPSAPAVRPEMANLGWFHVGCGGITLEVEFIDVFVWNGREHTGGRIGAIWVWSVVDR
ncbi:unnamed protein product [Laminaria digitata]